MSNNGNRLNFVNLLTECTSTLLSYSRYIEDELTKRKKLKNAEDNDNDEDDDAPERYMSPEDAALMSLPDHLRQSSTQRSEEMLSNQMLNGIPEVDLGIDAKIRNIEATEMAKDKLLMEHRNRKDGPSKFVPTNMAVNFVQHNRCKCHTTHNALSCFLVCR